MAWKPEHENFFDRWERQPLGENVDLRACYRQAWKGFRSWWIPLCLIAFIGQIVNYLPQFLAEHALDKEGFLDHVWALAQAVQSDNTDAILYHFEVIKTEGTLFGQTLLLYFLYFLPIALPVAVLLIIFSLKASSKDGLDVKEDTKAAGRRGIHVLLASLLAIGIISLPFVASAVFSRWFLLSYQPRPAQALITISSIFFLASFVVVYLYTLLFFAPQLAADGHGPVRAMLASCRMVKGSFFKVFLLIMINVILQALSLPTVIGLIPVTAFVNTARGAAYYQLLKKQQAAIEGQVAEPMPEA
jgi:hypothetical protein